MIFSENRHPLFGIMLGIRRRSGLETNSFQLTRHILPAIRFYTALRAETGFDEGSRWQIYSGI
jgi:hypothetical protein